MSYDSVILAESSLVHYYPLNESSGNALDAKGSINGTIGTSVTQNVAGILPATDGETAYSFDGNNLHTGVEFASAWLTTTPFSVEFWWNATNIASQNPLIYCNADLNSFTGWGLTTGGTGALNIQFANNHFTGISVTTGTHYYVVTFDGTTIQSYKDKVAQTPQTPGQTLSGSRAKSLIGPSSNGGALAGTIEKVAIYNAVLTQAQVTAHWNAANSISSGRPTRSLMGVGL